MPRDHPPVRQRPVSCRFCRTRRLRCSREVPCSNCLSRGLRCELEMQTVGSSSSSSARSALGDEILERLQHLEQLLVTERAKKDDEPTKQAHSILASNGPLSPSQTLSHLEIQGLAHDVAELEGIYTGQGVAVCRDTYTSLDAIRIGELTHFLLRLSLAHTSSVIIGFSLD